MNAAIVHYHLGHGGVPQTIRSHSASLSQSGIRHIILAGSHLPDDAFLPVALVPSLGYTHRTDSPDSAAALARNCLITATHHLGTPPDLWHFHNHSLGKNPALTEAVAHLAQAGQRILLHIHDLAEDGRPALCSVIRRIGCLYPISSHIHYAFLNERDRSTFLLAGLPPSQAHLLEGGPQSLPSSASRVPTGTSPLLFAPIRGIRRKNLGELTLLSVLLPPPARVAISRAPADPASLSIHNTWQAFAARHAPRIRFAVTDRIPPQPDADSSFASWVRHATHIVGTSIAEGFGLPFIEARAWNKPFLGRRIPHLGHLAPAHGTYDRLLVPADWIAPSILRQYLETTIARDDRTRGCHPRLPHLERILAGQIQNGRLDFGNLPEPLQQAVIERCEDPSSREDIRMETCGEILPALPWLAARTDVRMTLPPPPAGPPHRELPALLAIYQKILSSPPPGTLTFLPADNILHGFHTPESFHFLTAPPAPQPPHRFPYQVILFDIYGTLLHTRCGPARPDPAADPSIAQVLRKLGFKAPDSPTRSLHEAVLAHHASAAADFPEVDLRTLWRRILDAPPDADLDRLVIATEAVRSPSRPVHGAFETVRLIAASGIRIGLLSNAQCNALPSLDPVADLFNPELILLSHRFGHAKPSPLLFGEMTRRLRSLGILPHQVLLVGDSPEHDIIPAQSQGWHTALFSNTLATGCSPTFTFPSFPALLQLIRTGNPPPPSRSGVH